MSVDEEWEPAEETGVRALNIVTGGGYFLLPGGYGDGMVYADSPEGPWELATLPANIDALWGGAYGNGRFVIVGNNTSNAGVILTATTPGGTWSHASSSPTGDRIYDAAFHDGRWVACGVDRILTTTTPAGSWSVVTSGLTSAGTLYAVAHGGGYWVAVGTNGIYYASDPTGTWSHETFSGTAIDVDHDGTNWLVVGRSGASLPYTGVAVTATSPAGTWSSASPGGTPYRGYSVGKYLDDTWIVTGDNQYNADPITLRYATSIGGTWTSVEVASGAGANPYIGFEDGGWVLVCGESGNSVAYQGGAGHGWGLLL